MVGVVTRSQRVPMVTWIYGLFLVAGVAQTAIVPLLPRLSEQYGLTPAGTGLLLSLPGLAMLGVSVPAGVLADRFGPRRCTLCAGLLLCVSCLAQAVPALAPLIAGRLVYGVAFGFVWTTGTAWLSELDTDGRGLVSPSVTCSSLGTMLGPAVGGLLAGVATPGLVFALVSVAAAVAVAPLLAARGPAVVARPVPSVREPAAGTHAEPVGSPGDRLKALAAVLRQPGVISAIGAMVVSGAVVGSTQLLISTGLHHDGISTGRIGLVFSAGAVAYITASLAVLRFGRRAHTLRFNAIATGAIVFALLPGALSGAAPVLVAILMVVSMPRAAVGTICYSLASGGAAVNGGRSSSGDAAGSEDGSVFGIVNGAWAAATVVAPLIAGLLEQHGGARLAFLAVIGPGALVALALLTRSRPVRAQVTVAS